VRGLFGPAVIPDHGVAVLLRRAQPAEQPVRRQEPEKQHAGFAAQLISGVAIIPCESARDEISEAALAAALDSGGPEGVTRLYRHHDVPEDDIWLKAPGWCLAIR
jgi:hypothetical protein